MASSSYSNTSTEPIMEDNIGSPDPLYVILTSCLAHLSALDLVYITCSSKTLGQVCEAKLREGNREAAHRILRECVATASAVFASDNGPCRIRYGLKLETLTGEIELISPQPEGLRRSYKALEWLVRKSGGGFFDPADPLGPETARALLHTSPVPGPHAVVLVQAGFSPSPEQTVAASIRGFEGRKLWDLARRRVAAHYRTLSCCAANET
jgi:hypothetical protein